jgi:FKBP-type peptidyl-prolyl cis-trans isomerase SlyD
MKNIENPVVSIHYTLTNKAGEKLDSSIGSEPLTYIQGAGNIIPGLESALADKSVGDKLTNHRFA